MCVELEDVCVYRRFGVLGSAYEVGSVLYGRSFGINLID